MLRTIQDRYNELMTDRGQLSLLLHKGADKAGAVAAATLDRAYAAIGFLPR
jgi:tryptophanyl-tRNA synthetase